LAGVLIFGAGTREIREVRFCETYIGAGLCLRCELLQLMGRR
jgi:hypothetical protein